MADKRRDVGSTHQEPSQCTQKTPVTLVHLFGEKVIRVGDVVVRCVDLGGLEDVVVLRVLFMLNP
eukprot:2096004-Prorocentrum_lima.AAC.1